MVVYYEARVLFDYAPVKCDELRLSQGESVEVRVDPEELEQCEEGWLWGSDFRGQHGTFPANYVSDLRTAASGIDVSRQPPAPPRDHDRVHNSSPSSFGTSTVQVATTEGGCIGRRDESRADFTTRPNALLVSAEGRVDGQENHATEDVVGEKLNATSVGFASSSSNLHEDPRVRAGVDEIPTLHRPIGEGQTSAKVQANDADNLPDGWFFATEEASGEVYYYTEDGRTSRTRPIQLQARGDSLSREGAAIRIQAARRGQLVREKANSNEEGGRNRLVREGVVVTVGGSSAAERQERALEKKTAKLIASVVDSRLKEELRHRDAILFDIQAAINALAIDHRAAGPAKERRADDDDCNNVSPPRLRRKSPSPIPPSKRSNKREMYANEALDSVKEEPGGPRSPSCYSLELMSASPPVPTPATSDSCRNSRENCAAASKMIERSPPSPSPPRSQKPPQALARGAAPGSTLKHTTRDGESFGVPHHLSPQTGRGPTAWSNSDVLVSVDASKGRVRGERGGKKLGALSGGGGGETLANPIPRVADFDGVQRLVLSRQRAKAAGAAALVKQARGRAAVYNPSWYNPEHADTTLPDSELILEYVHGYAGETPRGGGGAGAVGGGGGGGGGALQAATWSTNVLWLQTGELAFPASGVVVIHDIEANRQRFIVGHDEEVTALAVHPFKDIVASGQAGKEAIVCLFDASTRRTGGSSSVESRLAKETAGGGAGAPPPQFLRELSLGKKEKRGVAALDFSPDGSLILAMAGGEGQALSIWDWRRGARLATARAETSFLPASSARFNPWLFLEGARAEAAGLPPGEACYTLVSCGQRHVKFWTLTRERTACSEKIGAGARAGIVAAAEASAIGGYVEEERIRGEGKADGSGRGWAWSLASKPGSFGARGEVDTMRCMAFIGEPWGGRKQRCRRLRRGADFADDEIGLLPIARTVTGAENGQIYIWDVAESRPRPYAVAASVSGLRVGWKPHGRLVAVVSNAHEGPLTDMCYLPHRGGSNQAGVSARRFMRTGNPGVEEWGRLATCGGEGTLKLWGVVGLGGVGPSPLQLLLAVDVSSKGIGIGHARSVSWDSFGKTLAVGTAGNAVCLVQLQEEMEMAGDLGFAVRKRAASVIFNLVVQGHTGSCKALAPHPTRPWFVTGGRDRVLRLWDAHLRRQLSAARLLERLSSAAFHPAGDILAVGNDAGDLLLMALRWPTWTGGNKRRQTLPDGLPSEGFSWDVLARKRMVHGGTAAANRAPALQPELASPPRRRGSGKEEIYSEINTGAVKNIGGGTRGHALSTTGAYQADQSWRQSKPSPSTSGMDRAVRRNQPSSEHPVDMSQSPWTKDRRGGSLLPRARGEGGREGVAGGGAASSFPSTIKDVDVVRFSPGGEVLAASSGSFIHLYREGGNSRVGRTVAAGSGGSHLDSVAYRRYAVCTGHGSRVKSIDVSIDGLVIQSNDAGGELLFWETVTGRQITNTFSLRDLEMDSWSSSIGWPAQGLAMAAAAAKSGSSGHSSNGSTGGVVAVCRSNAGDVMAMSDEDNCVNLVRNPAPEGADVRASWGHTAAAGVCGLTFLCDDRRLVSAGGACIFVWRHVRRRSQSDRHGPQGDRNSHDDGGRR